MNEKKKFSLLEVFIMMMFKEDLFKIIEIISYIVK
jgi:hypothetical protein